MNELRHDDFSDYFKALWGFPPFAWQEALAERVLNETDSPWPGAIALPTAAGKTACIDIAVFALAMQASRSTQSEMIDAPRRIFFVVDRRVIVDEAYDRAERLAKILFSAKPNDGVVHTVANALRMVAHGSEDGWEQATPLSVHSLRGASFRSESWARSPLQPAVIASTVDQFGSRLLFRAYGRRPGMWPVFAGLASNDSLILLDEAHCARPFLQTLQAVQRYQAWGAQPLHRSFNPVVLSATPPPGLDTFTDTSSEPQDPSHPLGRRQMAHKPAMLQYVPKAKGKRATEYFAGALADQAETLCAGEPRAIVVFANRVATARAVSEQLSKRNLGKVTLLIGRMRSVDKQTVIDNDLKPLASSTAEDRQLEQAHFIVATQTLEVGADLDFDGLVTECAALDALRQRFGRLNRMGRPIKAPAAILLRGDQGDDDPVYGAALKRTWTWLEAHADDSEKIDFGIAHLPRCNESELEQFNSPSLDAPVMLPAHVDCWVQTSPQPLPSPDVSLFLHGPRETRPDVNVCWRISPTNEALQLCPPSASETLPVPISLFRRWMVGEALSDDSSDVEGETSSAEADTPDESIRPTQQVYRWTDRQLQEIDHPGEIRPGDLIIIEPRTEDYSVLGKLPETASVNSDLLDISEQAYLSAKAKARLHLHPAKIGCWPSENAQEVALALLAAEDEDPDHQLRLLRELLDQLTQGTQGSKGYKWLHDIATQLRYEARHRGFLRQLKPLGNGRAFMLCGQGLIADYTRQAETFSDDTDSSSSSTSNKQGLPILLRDHLPGVRTWARRFALGCGLPPPLVEAITCAGLLHDLGKADPRVQALLRGGTPLSAAGEPLAKSAAMPTTVRQFEAARSSAGYPKGGRHELLSVRLAESAPDLLPTDPLLRELTLYLISSHHGHCRPFAPVVIDDEAPEVHYHVEGHELHWQGPTCLEHLGAGIPRRFWILVKSYGWWGLAWLEALLRLADHRRSEEEQSTSLEKTNV